eukprot:6313606-Heterocapsa_arctica.AAC.1
MQPRRRLALAKCNRKTLGRQFVSGPCAFAWSIIPALSDCSSYGQPQWRLIRSSHARGYSPAWRLP